MFMLIAHKRNKILLTLLLLKKLDLKCMTINDATGSNDTDGLNATSEPNDGNSPNVTSGPNEGVDEVFYGELNDADGDNSESDLVDGDNLLSDDDEEEMVAIKNKSKLVEDLGLDVVLEESVHVSIEKNEDVRGLGSGEEMDYLDSSDVCSYETDSDGGIICKKCGGTDPNGTFELMVERPTESKKPKFRRLYMRFSALKEGFKRFCRSVISLDGCYLKRSFKGEILSVVGRDGNNQNFPIAWAPVEVENKDTWAWLLQNIQNDLNLGDDSKFTLISDIQKGLLEEFHQCLPNVEHKFCARHMYANWKKLHRGGDLQLLFWSCCKATTCPQFEQYSSRIGQLKKKTFDDLMLKDLQHWSKALFSTRSKCDTIESNFLEAFNSAILGAEFKSIISMFEEIRHYVMLRLVEHKKDHLAGKMSCAIELKKKKLEIHKGISAYCDLIWNEIEGYEVMCHQDISVGDIRGWTCTCRVQTEGAQTKFAQQAATSSPSTQPMPTSPHTQPPVLSMPSRYNVTAHGPRERTITYFVACLIFLLLLTVDIVMLLMIL
ncbi:hypothetical protein V6N13_042594 [Hibiscus sabdariffa]